MPREGLGKGLVSVSNPTSPKLPLAAPLAPETRRSKSTVLHVAPGSAPTEVQLPIDRARGRVGDVHPQEQQPQAG